MPFGLPTDASLLGHRTDAALLRTTVMVTSLAAVALALLVAVIIRYRARPGRRAEYLRGDSRQAAFSIAGIALLSLGGIDLALIGPVPRQPHFGTAVRVEIMPQQFAWNIRYAGLDARFGTADDVVTLNDLRAPLGEPVTVQLVAKDVIHSFFLPNLRIKQDAIPGRITRTWFQATRAGHYEIACSQLCGFAHYQMRGVLSVTSRVEFDRWLAVDGHNATRSYEAADRAAHWGWEWHE